jgi:hypothetical protein
MLYAVGWSEAGWGQPKRFSGASSGDFVVKLGKDAVIKWNVFGFGGTRLALDSLKNIYLSGDSRVMQLSPKGAPKWSSSIGSDGYNELHGLTVVGDTYVYASGLDNQTWGNPLHPHSGEYDMMVAKIH